MRLQVLAAMGRCDEVLTAVESLRPKMDALPLESDAPEAVNPWNVREVLLHTGRTVAIDTERWETALAFNSEVVKVKLARGADARDVARTRFNDYSPLLRLRRYDDTRALLTAAGPSSRPSVTSRCLAVSTVPWPTWKTKPAAGPRLCASRRWPSGTTIRPGSPRAAPSATTIWAIIWSARAPTRPRSWPIAWPRPLSACRCNPVCCRKRCATWRTRTCPQRRPP